MEGSRGGSGAKSSRPASVNEYLVKGIVVAGCIWMFLDAMFTLTKAYDVFVVKNFFIRAAIAFCVTTACVAAQKMVFELFIHPNKQEEFRLIWDSGIWGKVGVTCGAIIIFAMIHFSWTATGSGIGISKGAFLTPDFGVPDVKAATEYFSAAFFGAIGAFFDEGMFYSARILK